MTGRRACFVWSRWRLSCQRLIAARRCGTRTHARLRWPAPEWSQRSRQPAPQRRMTPRRVRGIPSRVAAWSGRSAREYRHRAATFERSSGHAHTLHTALGALLSLARIGPQDAARAIAQPYVARSSHIRTRRCGGCRHMIHSESFTVQREALTCIEARKGEADVVGDTSAGQIAQNCASNQKNSLYGAPSRPLHDTNFA